MKEKGFTIIELLAVIVILGFITVLGISRLNNYKYNQISKLDADSALSILSSARVKAQSGEYGRNYNVVINSQAKTLTLNLVQTDISDPTVTETVTLDNRTSISTNISGNAIEFERFKGSTTNTGTITLTTTSGSFSSTKTITVYSTGLATLQ